MIVEDDTKKKLQISDTDKNKVSNASSKYYKIGDAVDVIYQNMSAWFEARIINIFTKNNKLCEDDLIFEVVMDRKEKTASIQVGFKDIRPRSFYVYNKSELALDMSVFVNYNIEKPKDTGYW